jgi:bifunctional ADP-heptose synthase (sugar kinase/adenylyltransferase)
MLDAIKGVNEVVVFDSQEELENILKYYQADVMVKGSDYKDKPIIGSEYCREIVFVDRLDEYSTSAKIQDITSRG